MATASIIPSISQAHRSRPLSLSKFVLLVAIFSTPFSLPFVGETQIGFASARYLRDMLFIFFFLFIILATALRRNTMVSVPQDGSWALLFWILFSAYYAFTLLFTPFFADGLRYLPKVFYPYLFFLAIYADRTMTADDIVKAAAYGMVACLAISILLHFGGVTPGPYMEGPSGRHFLKFVAVAAVVLSFSLLLTRGVSGLGIALGVLGALSMYLILQRGAVIATIIGLVTVILSTRLNLRRERLGFFVAAGLGAVGLLLIVTSSAFIEYAFYQNASPALIFNQLLEGNLDTELIRDRGRHELMTILSDSESLSLGGLGIGSVPSLLGPYFGKDRFDLHNDLLLVLYEGGFISAFLFFVAIVLTFRWIIKTIKKSPNRDRFISRTALGLFSGFFVWMAFSNVFNYSAISLSYIFIFLAAAEKLHNHPGMRVARASPYPHVAQQVPAGRR